MAWQQKEKARVEAKEEEKAEEKAKEKENQAKARERAKENPFRKDIAEHGCKMDIAQINHRMAIVRTFMTLSSPSKEDAPVAKVDRGRAVSELLVRPSNGAEYAPLSTYLIAAGALEQAWSSVHRRWPSTSDCCGSLLKYDGCPPGQGSNRPRGFGWWACSLLRGCGRCRWPL